jgi:hypothetical protein
MENFALALLAVHNACGLILSVVKPLASPLS